MTRYEGRPEDYRRWNGGRDDHDLRYSYGSDGRPAEDRFYEQGARDDRANRGADAAVRYGMNMAPYGFGSPFMGYPGMPFMLPDAYAGRSHRPHEGRSWWDRTSDNVSSWFGNQDSGDRNNVVSPQSSHRGKGPRNYRRSDERIAEEVNDRLTDDPFLDASDIEVTVQNSEVTLSGLVISREDKRTAERCAEAAAGVADVHNHLKINREGLAAATKSEDASPTY